MGSIILRLFTSVQVGLYRLTGGLISSVIGFKVLLLTTQGRKSGVMRTTPVGYFVDGSQFVIVASNSGADANPGWYLNLKANPHVQVQIKNQVMQVTAETTAGEERQRLWNLVISEAPAYGRYAQRTSRQIPVVVLKPT